MIIASPHFISTILEAPIGALSDPAIVDLGLAVLQTRSRLNNFPHRAVQLIGSALNCYGLAQTGAARREQELRQPPTPTPSSQLPTRVGRCSLASPPLPAPRFPLRSIFSPAFALTAAKLTW